MPYSDNLYSADDSDTESFSDELSPTDGYFMQRDHPQGVMVPDPSLEPMPGMAESKAQEAGEEAEAVARSHTVRPPVSPIIATSTSSQPYTPAASSAAYTPSSPTSYVPLSPASSHRRHDDFYSETTSLLHPAPPPTYSAATSSTTSQTSRQFSRNYRTVSNEQLEEGLVQNQEPESMGGPASLSDRHPVWMTRVKKYRTWDFVRNALLILLVLGIGAGFLITAMRAGQSQDDGDVGDRPPIDPDRPNSPTMPKPPVAGHGPYCSAAKHRFDHMPTYEFTTGSDRSLVIVQVNEEQEMSGNIEIAGRVIFRRREDVGDVLKDPDSGYITLDAYKSDESFTLSTTIDNAEQALRIHLPSNQPVKGMGWHCISLEVTVWLPDNAVMENVQAYTSQLSIEFMDNVNLQVDRKVALESAAGNIIFPQIDERQPEMSGSKSMIELEEESPSSSTTPATPPTDKFSPNNDLQADGLEQGLALRETYIETASGYVTGRFNLYDRIEIAAQSGKIEVDIFPREALATDPKPAVLKTSTSSGNVRIRYPVHGQSFPERDYQTFVTTQSGKLGGKFFIGSHSDFTTTSGSLDVVLLPVITSASPGKSSYNTQTYSGLCTVVVLPLPSTSSSHIPREDKFTDIGNDDPYLTPRIPSHPDAHDIASSRGVAIRELVAGHESTSGSLKVRYPEEWEGKMQVETVSGGIKVGGPDLRIVSDSHKNYAWRELIARKGENADQGSVLSVRAVSGSVEIWVGTCPAQSWCA